MLSSIPEIWIARQPEEVIREAARRVAELAKKSITARGKFELVLSGGQTPQELYRILAKNNLGIDWSKVEFFFGDERHVSKSSADSTSRMVHELLFEPLHIAASHIHAIPTSTTVEESAALYEASLRELHQGIPSFDLVLLGLGTDGHTASIFPGDSRLEGQEDDTLCWSTKAAPQLPRERVTLTPFVLRHARQILVLVCGSQKAAAVSAALESDATPIESPMRGIVPHHGRLSWLIDKDAASALTR